MIREATLDDIPQMLVMGQRFFTAAGWDDIASYDPDSMERTMRFLIEGDSGVIFVLDDDGLVGMAGAMVNPFYFNASHLTGSELFWWVEPEHRGHGGLLFDNLEAWAAGKGVQTFAFVAVDRLKPKVMGRLYEMRGYRASEHSYIKRFGP